MSPFLDGHGDSECSPAGHAVPHTVTEVTERRARARGKTVSNAEEWRMASHRFPLSPVGGWAESASEASSSGESASDSAYGTVDDHGEASQRWRKSRGSTKRTRRRTVRSRSVGDSWHSPPAQDSLFTVEYPSLDDSSDDSFTSTPSPASVASSRRSSPEPSECDFDELPTPTFPPSPTSRPSSAVFLTTVPSLTNLSRRHTVPRRTRNRAPSISISFVNKVILEPSPTSSTSLSSLTTKSIRSPGSQSVSTACAIATAALSLSSALLPHQFALLPASPIHLLHPHSHYLLQYTNAALSPLLVTPSTSSIALGLANLASLATFESDECPKISALLKTSSLVGIWGGIVAVRVTLAWIFGRVLGWAHPHLFSTSAIHQVGSGLAPLLLTLYILQTYRRPTRDASRLAFPIGLLAANFSTPIEQGGTGLWWGISCIVVGLALCAVMSIGSSAQRWGTPISIPVSKKTTTPIWRYLPLLCLVVLPFFSAHSTPARSATTLDTSFASLHPHQPHLLTVLLMSAPRPGQPDFLIRSVESWLDALPEPSIASPVSLPSHDASYSNSTFSLDPSSRIRMIVYTHFRTHDVFDNARAFFGSSPLYAAKAAHYLEWHRDPRGQANRLDQRLHVARGLAYASSHGGESAYVMLTEDDFPLCPDDGGEGKSWNGAWDNLRSALVATNEAMPDLAPSGPSYAEMEATSGHCGLFVATGGSGLAIRGFIAARLPALLLGADDADGAARDARAERGEFSVKHEDEGADTPDLVIQDCLRGRIPGCGSCAPGGGAPGSARRPGGVRGERWGKSGLAGTEKLMQRHLGYNASTLPGRKYGKEEWACGWRQPFNGEPDVLTV